MAYRWRARSQGKALIVRKPDEQILRGACVKITTESSHISKSLSLNRNKRLGTGILFV